MEYDIVEEIIYGLESGILFGYFCFPLLYLCISFMFVKYISVFGLRGTSLLSIGNDQNLDTSHFEYRT